MKTQIRRQQFKSGTKRVSPQARQAYDWQPRFWRWFFQQIALLSKLVQSREKTINPQLKPSISPSPARRLIMVWGVLMLGMLGLFARLFFLQIVDGPTLSQQARAQQTVQVNPFTPRRPIIDRLGNVLAIDQPIYQLFVHPILFKRSRSEIARQLSPILGKTPEQLIQAFQSAQSGIRLESALAEEVADRVKALGLDGLELLQGQKRLYPQQDLAANVVGYMDHDRRPQAGVEYSQESLLERSTPPATLRRTANGALMSDELPTDFWQTDNLRLQLTLDLRLQRVLRSSLSMKLERYNAKRGTVIVMDARDGSLLALISEPSYDPNQYYKANIESFKNWAATDLYEPGSTFKPLNVAIALETGAIQPTDHFNDSGRIHIDGWPVEDYDYSTMGAKGWLSLTDVLKYSSNVGMVRIIQKIKPEKYYAWLGKLNLGQKSGVDLPFEVPSQLKPRQQFLGSPIEPATTSFGQGFSLTPIQLVQALGSLANGGKLVTPHVVKGLFNADGEPYWQPNFPEQQIFSPQTTQQVLAMMEVVVKDGTGKTAKLPNYRIAGKTGTAQKANPNGGYSNSVITSFVGILPVEAPRYVVLAVIDEPKGDNAFGSTVAAPIVKTVMESLVALEGIPPTQVPTNSTP